MRLIDADSVVVMTVTCPKGMDIDSFIAGMDVVLDRIAEAPTVDAVQVVQCGECIYAPSGTDSGDDRGFALEWPHDQWPEDNPCPCKCDDGWYSHKPAPDFFCMTGKLKDIECQSNKNT